MKKTVLLAGLVVAVAAAAGGALAAFPDTNVDSYTGCVNSGGQIAQVATGSNPLKPCGPNDTLVHLSGGDITKVTAGSGLTGGGDNGAVSLSLASGFQLPQGCAAGKISRWDGSAWQCADQQTYTGGAGLDLTGNQFSVKSEYQLPQGCTSGQSAASNGDGTWKCQDSVGGLSDYINWSGPWEVGCGFCLDSETRSTTAWCNYGDIATGGGFYNDNTDIEYSNPSNRNGSEGWYVQAHNGAFSSGHYEAWVKCLHMG